MKSQSIPVTQLLEFLCCQGLQHIFHSVNIQLFVWGFWGFLYLFSKNAKLLKLCLNSLKVATAGVKAMRTHSDIMWGSSVSGHMSPFLSVIYNIARGVIPAWQKDSTRTWCYYKLLFTFTVISEGHSFIFSQTSVGTNLSLQSLSCSLEGTGSSN